MFHTGDIRCLSLNEIIAEKLRAAALRLRIAPRDFYDLDYIVRSGFQLQNQGAMKLFQMKLQEGNADTNLTQYKSNLGRSDAEINEMKSRIEEELLEVLTQKEREKFNIDSALQRINSAMKGI